MTRYVINPDRFTESQWVELCNVDTLVPRTYEQKHRAKPFSRSKKAIELAILCCHNKAQRILDGELGEESEAGEDEGWANDLRGAAEVLEAIIGSPRLTRKQAKARLRDLLESDIYTDAPEYADRVEEIHRLIPMVL